MCTTFGALMLPPTRIGSVGAQNLCCRGLKYAVEGAAGNSSWDSTLNSAREGTADTARRGTRFDNRPDVLRDRRWRYKFRAPI